MKYRKRVFFFLNFLGRDRPMKAWTDTVRKIFDCMAGPAVHGLRRWKRMAFLIVTGLRPNNLEMSCVYSQRSQPNQ